ncbi:MAG: exonuclease, partial [Dehalococcoidia bacterium]|nr:exonuclease [Dehalococcoidia bacterium]
MTSLTFYGGVDEIGGNKILLHDGGTRLFFDFGISYGRRKLFYEEYLNPRANAGLRDMLEMGLLPPLRGIYRDDLLEPDQWKAFSDRPGYEEMEVHGILLSHAHFDHSGYISFLNESIPVSTSLVTAVISKAIQDSAKSDFEKEVCFTLRREYVCNLYQSVKNSPAKHRPFLVFSGGEIPQKTREFWEDIPGKRGLDCCPLKPAGKIGNLPVRQFPVDHSIYGASAYAVETEAGWICYSGDLRFHGGAADYTRTFAEKAAALKPRVLICEGTRITDKNRVTEDEVYLNALDAVKRASGLVLADFGARNIERLLIFHRIAGETSRQLVVMPRDAYLLDKLSPVMDAVPTLEDSKDLLIYTDPKARLDTWEREIRGRLSSRLIGAETIRKNQGNYILCFSFWDLNDLVDLAPDNGVYIDSSSEVFDEEGGIDMKRLHSWADHFHLKKVGLPVPT